MKEVFFSSLICFFLSVNLASAQQWSGSSTTSGGIARYGNVSIDGEGLGFIVDAQGLQRIGFMKYSGKYGGIWRNPDAWFEIGRVSGNILSPTGFTTDLYISSGGNVGIGTTAPGTFKLAVEGKIGAREIRITNTNPWPDYVFNPDYELPSLKAQEEFISQHQHLPGIPSAADIKAQGYDLSSMDASLLKKIEELTLYIIELNKKIETLKQSQQH
ncbi:hypothetical protein SAMN04488505_102512 [Chitinophaga rupis]|uniref:Uncharacterized protein n=1 Tax=Chitinophaga rupis TaxID=573321 RepID=A0A1H7R310_9BACT|nr:hypothetical protein [Chitinophaga rupis]SEL54552.1 hypothetical protein SAMN04488505_102512 [Chitinophaga rupis]